MRMGYPVWFNEPGLPRQWRALSEFPISAPGRLLPFVRGARPVMSRIFRTFYQAASSIWIT
jgi:hypothetical protein